jgi:hypothetical protein
MNGARNRYLRLVTGRFYIVLRNGDEDIKIFAGDNIASARETRDDLLRGLGRLKPLAEKRRAVREEAVEEKPFKRLPRRTVDYYAAGCVLLLAAVYQTQEAYDWAMDSLHGARAIDARRFA